LGGRRITGSGATLSNNYGLQSMSGGTWTSNATGNDGADVTAATETWWKTTANWNAKFGGGESAPWVWGSTRPVLWWE
jgi:hypothetical protein